MNDEIKLPPLPDNGTMLAYGADTLRDYARLAVEQDRARRERPEPHGAIIECFSDGIVTTSQTGFAAQHNIILRWTPKRAWIESERNRELAQELRKNACCPLDYDAADALDGGQQ